VIWEETRKATGILSSRKNEAKYQSKLALAEADEIEQWNRTSSVRILKLPGSIQRESYRDFFDKVTHNLALDLNVPQFSEEHDIDICNRVGRSSADGPQRQVFVKFLRRSTKQEVTGGRERTPKGVPFIAEELTKHSL